MNAIFWLHGLCLSFVCYQEPATGEELDVEYVEPTPEEVDARFEWRTGSIQLQNGLATLELGPGFRYLDPEQARMVLEDIWGNPPDRTLGMVFPADRGPISDGAWAVVLTYASDGHVPDEDANEIDYGEMLADMQESAEEENAARTRAGYGTIEVVGWAAAPHYDPAAHKLYWAKELRFDGAPDTVLNYDVRVLGRRGVLSMNAVASMGQLDEVRAGMETLLASVRFRNGERYEDFHSKLDQVAAYGVGGLIAGKVALKVGLWKGLVAGLLAAKKLVIVAVAVLGGSFVKLFNRKKAASTQEP